MNKYSTKPSSNPFPNPIQNNYLGMMTKQNLQFEPVEIQLKAHLSARKIRNLPHIKLSALTSSKRKHENLLPSLNKDNKFDKQDISAIGQESINSALLIEGQASFQSNTIQEDNLRRSMDHSFFARKRTKQYPLPGNNVLPIRSDLIVTTVI